MLFPYIIPIFLGFFSVLQISLSKTLAQSHGLAPSILLNSSVIISLSLLMFLLSKSGILQVDHFFSDKIQSYNFKWWHIIPGTLGFCIITGLPLSMSRLSALSVFIGFIIAQIVASLLWDTAVDQVPISIYKILGVMTGVASVILINL